MWSLDNLIFKLIKAPRIGLFISGGFDSATLAYLICKLKCDNKLSTEIIIFTIPRYDDSHRHAKNIVNWLENQFQITLKHQIVGDPSLHHSKQVSSGIDQAKKLNPKVLLIIADTQNPLEELGGPGPVRIRSQSALIYQPWFDLDKTETIKIAQELGVLDQIAKLSHTCTESIELRCKSCWQCRERQWAFNKLNIPDIGDK
jgi:7-cyano-7-deazaguanine synthase in queuosine biosynthesis